MTTEELLTTITHSEYSAIRESLQSKLIYLLQRNGFGCRVAKVTNGNVKGENKVLFGLTVIPLTNMNTDAMRRLSNVLNEARAELESVNKEYEGYKFVY